MGILNIAPAERAGAHLLIQLYGPPRSGKTYTALRIARGMVGPEGQIGVLDTESGRARLYSDKVPSGFVVGELTPPRPSISRPSLPSPPAFLRLLRISHGVAQPGLPEPGWNERGLIGCVAWEYPD